MSEYITIPEGTDYIFCGINRNFHQAVHFYLLVKKVNDEGLNIEVHPAIVSLEWQETFDMGAAKWIVEYTKAAFPAVHIGEIRQVRYHMPEDEVENFQVAQQKHTENSYELVRNFCASVPSNKKIVIYTGDVELPNDEVFAQIAEMSNREKEVEDYKLYRGRSRITLVETETHGEVPILRPFVENNITAYDVYGMMVDNDITVFLDHTTGSNCTTPDFKDDDFTSLELAWIKTQYS